MRKLGEDNYRSVFTTRSIDFETAGRGFFSPEAARGQLFTPVVLFIPDYAAIAALYLWI